MPPRVHIRGYVKLGQGRPAGLLPPSQAAPVLLLLPEVPLPALLGLALEPDLLLRTNQRPPGSMGDVLGISSKEKLYWIMLTSWPDNKFQLVKIILWIVEETPRAVVKLNLDF